MKSETIDQGGEIVASAGSDEVWIKLAVKYPCVVMVKFVDDCKPLPTCNAPIEDVLMYEIKHRNGHFHLVIAWNIFSPSREIRWDVSY